MISQRAVQEEVVTTGTAQQDPIVAVAQEIDQGTWQEADPRRDEQRYTVVDPGAAISRAQLIAHPLVRSVCRSALPGLIGG